MSGGDPAMVAWFIRTSVSYSILLHLCVRWIESLTGCLYGTETVIGKLLQPKGLWPQACKLVGRVEQTGGYYFSLKGKRKKTKFQLVKPGAQLSILYFFVR